MNENKWQERYEGGYTAFIQRSSQEGWTNYDTIPPLDGNGCSEVIILHFEFMDNPVGMSTPKHTEAGFFHARAGGVGCYYTLESRRGASRLLYPPDGWKRCDRPDGKWVIDLARARKRIEAGNWNF